MKNELISEPLTTERLILRHQTPEILTELFVSGNKSETMEYLCLKDDQAYDEAYLKYSNGLRTAKISFHYFAIIIKDSMKHIGDIGFHTWYVLHNRAEIGYAISAEEEREKGYMSEALNAVIKFGFDNLFLNRIEANIGQHNTASRKLLQKYGFSFEGQLRSHYLKDGVYEDSMIYSLLQSEYKSL